MTAAITNVTLHLVYEYSEDVNSIVQSEDYAVLEIEGDHGRVFVRINAADVKHAGVFAVKAYQQYALSFSENR